MFSAIKCISSQRLSSTFAHQINIPRLKIPTLVDTTTRYIESLKPLLSETSIQSTQNQIDTFIAPHSIGSILQTRLNELNDREPHSWLENIWLNSAYLKQRASLHINSNWWCMFPNAKDTPKQVRRTLPPSGVISSYQIKRAARLINHFLSFRQKLIKLMISGDVAVEAGKEGIVCMNQYKKMFSACRVPGLLEDTLITNFESTSTHIIVLLKNQVYKVNVLHPSMNMALNSEIERLLYAIGKDALDTQPEPNVAILTSLDRTSWANSYNALYPENSDNFETIQSALFCVCLDDNTLHQKHSKIHKQIMTAQNRWMDIGISLVVNSVGYAGVNGEHSACDAVVPARMFDDIVTIEMDIDESLSDSAYLTDPQKLSWIITDETKALIDRAESSLLEARQDYDSEMLSFEVYGSDYMKQIAKSSPDTFIQMVLQLAWYRQYNQPTPVYETGSTRKFLHGRTETIRSLSQESLDFVKIFDSKETLPKEKIEVWNKAISKHALLAKQASNGQGVDRHLMGLKSQLKEDEDESFFQSEGYNESQSFGLATSNMSSAVKVSGGFGPPNKNGYGVCYQIRKNKVEFCVSGSRSGTTNVKEFIQQIERIMTDLIGLFPSRTSVWGAGWETKSKREELSDRYFEKMKEFSKARMAKSDFDKQLHYTDKYMN